MECVGGSIMANYNVIRWTSSVGDVKSVITELHDKLETIDDSKTIRLCNVVNKTSAFVVAVLIYDA